MQVGMQAAQAHFECVLSTPTWLDPNPNPGFEYACLKHPAILAAFDLGVKKHQPA